MLKTHDIKCILAEKYKRGEFRVTKSGVKTVEIQGAQFIADKDYILREPNYDYAKREIEWYTSQSLYVNDIPGKTPVIWEQCADADGKINSNYGWMIWSKENGSQYEHCLKSLLNDSVTRQGVMLYNRPEMQEDWNKNGMHDFCCTYAVQCFLNPNPDCPDDPTMLVLDYHVFMRSNDAVFGYDNDYLWHKHVQEKLVEDLRKQYDPQYTNIKPGKIIWNAGSLHVYERHFKFFENIVEKSETTNETTESLDSCNKKAL